MTRYFFFALLFPPALMNLMLVTARPISVLHYFIAGYIIGMFPALVIALLDDALQRRSPIDRAGYGACAAFLSAPVPLWLIGQGTAWPCLQIGGFAAIAAFLCVLAFAQISAPREKLLMLPSPEQFKPVTEQA